LHMVMKSQLHFLHVLKDPKPQARLALLASADNELTKLFARVL